MQSYNKSQKKKFWGVNYRSVGKELVEDLKVLSPISEAKILFQKHSRRCFQTKLSKKPRRRKKNIRGGGQNLKY